MISKQREIKFKKKFSFANIINNVNIYLCLTKYFLAQPSRPQTHTNRCIICCVLNLHNDANF